MSVVKPQPDFFSIVSRTRQAIRTPQVNGQRNSDLPTVPTLTIISREGDGDAADDSSI
jgi:hypothetical protein